MTDNLWTTFTGILTPFLPRLQGDVTSETGLEDAGLDSLALVELLAELEKRQKIEFPADKLHWDTFATAGVLYSTTLSLLQPQTN